MSDSAENLTQKATSTPHTDDESITTSTESDSLETWTLVNDKNRKKDELTASTELVNANNRIEILTTSSSSNVNKESHENTGYRTDDDSNVDDVSEGISIISESESAGRASPIETEANLTDLNLSGYSNHENVHLDEKFRFPIRIPQSHLPSSSVNSSDENALRQRRIRRSSSNGAANDKSLQEKDDTVVGNSVYPFVRHSLKTAFIVCVFLATLAFIGKLLNPDWQLLPTNSYLSVLEQKLTDLELQNNLMRAEIDILSRQVKYLSDLSENSAINRDNVEKGPKYQHRHFKQTGEWIMKQKDKSFKAWPGNGNNLDPVEITKEDLRKPFKCPNGNYVEMAGMCIEKIEPNIKNVEDIINVVDDIVIEQIVEGIQSFNKDSATDSAPNANINKPGFKGELETEYNRNKKFINTGNRNSKERDSSEKKYDTQKHWKQHKNLYKDGNKSDEDEFSDEDDEASIEDFKKKPFNSKERYNKNDKERKNGNKYSERYQKERKFDKNSRERKYFDSDEQSPKSGEWHEKLMKQRETSRHENEYRQRNKNWYIERGNSREKMRHS
uniref:Uncharacterized protein n=1 Tax=Ceratitis capitata TaxID=7213 RepID=W8ARZ0_CERCA